MTILANNFRAAFNESKSPLIANVLIERVMKGDYVRTKEIGPIAEDTRDKQIIGTLYLLLADENTYPLLEAAEAFVFKLEHEARLVDYFVFTDVATAQAFLSAYE